jgi:hypothetical protein
VAEKWAAEDTDLPERTITEVRLMEVGPVVWPAYDGTDVGVRSLELARSLMAADDDTRREIATILLRGDSPVTVSPATWGDEIADAAVGTSDTTDTPADEAAAGTSTERAVTDNDEPADSHSRPYQPAQRPVLTLERLRADRERVAARVAAASARSA